MKKLEHAEQTWTRIMEGAVQAFRYDSDKNRFTLICDQFPDEEDIPRSFVALIFTGVSQFSRRKGDLAKYHRFTDQYQAGNDIVDSVIQHTKAQPFLDGTFQELWFGPNFGGITFVFKHVEGFVRNVDPDRTQEIDGRFIFRDVDDGEPFEYPFPFPWLQLPDQQT